MSENNIEECLKRFLEQGPDESFVSSCAEKFERISFSDTALPVARLYLFYLSATVRFLISEDTSNLESVSDSILERNQTFGVSHIRRFLELLNLDNTPENIAKTIGILAKIQVKKQSGGDFLTLFVDLWFAFWGEN